MGAPPSTSRHVLAEVEVLVGAIAAAVVVVMVVAAAGYWDDGGWGSVIGWGVVRRQWCCVLPIVHHQGDSKL